LDGRNSYSKTDTDATFMRMKEDHMLNGQLKPCYNIQMSSEDQFILNYSVHPNPTDTLTLPRHLAEFEQAFETTPDTLTADVGYGSEQNYELMEQKQIEAYVNTTILIRSSTAAVAALMLTSYITMSRRITWYALWGSI